MTHLDYRNIGKPITPVRAGWGNKAKIEANITCSLVKSPTIYLEHIVRQKLELLMTEYPHREWLAYLVGEVSEDGNGYFIEDIYIPPHESASAAEEVAEPFKVPDRCIGVIHSHNSMSAFHSGTDQTHVDKNFPVSITIAKKYQSEIEFDAVSTQYTPCNKAVTVKCPVKYIQPEPTFDTEEWLEDAKANVDKGIKVYQWEKPKEAKFKFTGVKEKPLLGFMPRRDRRQLRKQMKAGVITGEESPALSRGRELLDEGDKDETERQSHQFWESF